MYDLRNQTPDSRSKFNRIVIHIYINIFYRYNNYKFGAHESVVKDIAQNQVHQAALGLQLYQ